MSDKDFEFSEYIKHQYDEKERSDIESMAAYIELDKKPFEYAFEAQERKIEKLKQELETTKKLLDEARTIIEEMCVDDCGIDLANEDRESLEAIIMGNDEKCAKFLAKLSKEGEE